MQMKKEKRACAAKSQRYQFFCPLVRVFFSIIPTVQINLYEKKRKHVTFLCYIISIKLGQLVLRLYLYVSSRDSFIRRNK